MSFDKSKIGSSQKRPNKQFDMVYILPLCGNCRFIKTNLRAFANIGQWLLPAFSSQIDWALYI